MRAIDINEHLISELATGQEDKITRLTYRDTFLKLTALGIYPQTFAEQMATSAGYGRDAPGGSSIQLAN